MCQEIVETPVRPSIPPKVACFQRVFLLSSAFIAAIRPDSMISPSRNTPGLYHPGHGLHRRRKAPCNKRGLSDRPQWLSRTSLPPPRCIPPDRAYVPCDCNTRLPMWHRALWRVHRSPGPHRFFLLLSGYLREYCSKRDSRGYIPVLSSGVPLSVVKGMGLRRFESDRFFVCLIGFLMISRYHVGISEITE